MAKVIEFPATRIAKGIHVFTPEMGQRKPNCQMTARLCYYGNHYYIDTKLELKGQGVALVDYRDDGTLKYKVTCRAFEKLKQQYSVSMESNLD